MTNADLGFGYTLGKSGRKYYRKFDWDEAKRLHGLGWSMKDIADLFGVSQGSIRQIVNPALREATTRRSSEWQKQGVCRTCGGPCSRRRGSEAWECHDCSVERRTTSARDDELQCMNCREWKPDEDFPRNRSEGKYRRGRHGICRPCNTIIRRGHRERNREQDNKYSREYKRKRRAQGLA